MLPSDPARILGMRIAVTKWDNIGDFILATAFLQVLSREVPPGNVTLICWGGAAVLAQAQFPDWLVVQLPVPAAGASLFERLRRIFNIRDLLRGLGAFDLHVELRSTRSIGETVRASWIPAKLRIAITNNHELEEDKYPHEESIYDILLPRQQRGEPSVAVDIMNYRALARTLFPSLDESALWPTLSVGETDKQHVAGHLAGKCGIPVGQPFLLVCPGASSAIRVYPPELLATAVRSSLDAVPLPVVVGGAEADKPLAAEFLRHLGSSGSAVDVTGAFSLSQHIALIAMAKGVLCMETSHAHIAGALHTPCVVVIGGGHYGRFGPWGESPTFRWVTHKLPCFGCNWHCIYDRPMCIQGLPPQAVASALGRVLEAAATP